jgi:hypothetical protein
MLPPQVIAGFCMYGVVVLLAFFVALTFVKFFQDSYEESRLVTVVSVISMTLSFSVLMLVPVDVLSTSFVDDSSPARNILIETLYFFFFLAMMLLVFMIVPFSLFFFEEGQDASFSHRVVGGLKYSVAFIIVFLVLLVLGFVLRGSLETEHKVVLGNLDVVEFAVNFMVACTALIGLLVWFTYTAFGLSWLGISFLRGKQIDNYAEAEDLEREITIAREQRRQLNSKKITARSARQKDSEVFFFFCSLLVFFFFFFSPNSCLCIQGASGFVATKGVCAAPAPRAFGSRGSVLQEVHACSETRNYCCGDRVAACVSSCGFIVASLCN